MSTHAAPELPVPGVYLSSAPGGWPWSRPAALVELAGQLWDLRPRRRPVPSIPAVRAAVEALDRHGMAVLAGVAPPELVAAGRADLDRLVARMPELAGQRRTKRASTGGPRQYLVHEHQQDLAIHRTHDPLAVLPSYGRFLMLPALRELVAGYLGADWRYQAMIATRTEPWETRGQGFDQWHHDARGRKLNVFLLLSDVAEDGPGTMVLRGSHRLLYAWSRFLRNFLEDAEAQALARRYHFDEGVGAAPAGSLVAFDAHALHRGRRSPARRDAYQVNCMTKPEHLWSHEVPRAHLEALGPAEGAELLRRSRLRVT